MTRTFTIPRYQSLEPALQIKLVEPSLTADNLGHKTWLASYLLARRLPHLIANSIIPSPDRPLRILELGSGTGLLGITAATLYPTAQTRLTDLPAIVDNLAQNVLANTSLFDAANKPTVDVLDWSVTRDKARANSYDLILVSDPLVRISLSPSSSLPYTPTPGTRTADFVWVVLPLPPKMARKHHPRRTLHGQRSKSRDDGPAARSLPPGTRGDEAAHGEWGAGDLCQWHR